jgi:hypothetical protein
LATSVIKLAHVGPAAPVHIMAVPAHVVLQDPAPLQSWPPVHALPHVPQLPESLLMFTQVLLHDIWPPVHAHMPPEHASPVRQALRQAPQLELSVCRATHVLPQALWPAPQVHLPVAHCWLAPHTLSQSPQ